MLFFGPVRSKGQIIEFLRVVDYGALSPELGFSGLLERRSVSMMAISALSWLSPYSWSQEVGH